MAEGRTGKILGDHLSGGMSWLHFFERSTPPRFTKSLPGVCFGAKSGEMVRGRKMAEFVGRQGIALLLLDYSTKLFMIRALPRSPFLVSYKM